MLRRQKAAFAPVFYRRHRAHVVHVFVKLALWLLASGSLGAVSVAAYFETGRFPFLAAMLVAAFLYFLVAGAAGCREVFRVRLLPYFSKRLGAAGTWLQGESLLWHSRHLDDLATRLGVAPLTTFASGDDMVLGERLHWFDPRPALDTVARLRDSQEAASFPEALQLDLRSLQEALASASAAEAQFCFLLREGSTTSGAEMDRRKGSFF